MGAKLCKQKQDVAKDARQQSKKIDAKIEEDRKVKEKEDAVLNKLLLLGPAEAGKSTLLKQFRLIYTKGLSQNERANFRPGIVRNLIEAMVQVIEFLPHLDLKLEEENVQYGNIIQEQANQLLEDYESTFLIPIDYTNILKKLWLESKAIQTAIDREHEINLIESARYFFNNIDRILAPNYSPSDQDILNCRIMTTQVSETDVIIQRCPYRIIDVGGQRSLRGQWIGYFDDVKTIIFIVAISCYDQNLREDVNVNRMKDAIHLFGEIVKKDVFKKTAIMLFLNKIDIFKEKIKVSPISKYFPEYEDDGDLNKATGFFGKQFVMQSENPAQRIYTHLTWATDTSQIKIVIAIVTDIVLRMNLEASGF